MIKWENTQLLAWNARQINIWQGYFHCSLKISAYVNAKYEKNYLTHAWYLGSSKSLEPPHSLGTRRASSLMEAHFLSAPSSAPQRLHYLLQFSLEILSLLQLCNSYGPTISFSLFHLHTRVTYFLCTHIRCALEGPPLQTSEQDS